jgi:hypothetical protein
MSWAIVTDEWRLKLLGLGLAVLMLGAVAFAQNPPTTQTVSVGLNYPTPPAGIVLINPPPKTNVTFTGTSDAIKNVTANNVTATVDTSHAHPGLGVRLNVTPGCGGCQVNFQTPPPVVVNIDKIATKELPVTVQPVPRAAPGWSVTSAVAICAGAQKSNPCYVNFTGPQSWETNMQATVPFPGPPVNYTGPSDVLTQQVLLSNSNGPLDLFQSRTIPASGLDYPTVTIEVKAVAGSNYSTVPLVDSAPSHPPPPGYHITGITISPVTVIISGDPAVLGRIQRIILTPLDLSGRTSDSTFQVAIDYTSLGVSGNVANATVKYSISPNPNVSASP